MNLHQVQKYLLITMIALVASVKAMAINGVDPIRAGLFKKYGTQAKKALAAQDALLGVNYTMHMYHKQQIENITVLHREFNKYLEDLGDILSIAAEIYGIYYEVDQAIKNVRELKKNVATSPSNIVAVALSERKNNIYRDVIDDGIQIAADIAQILPLKANKGKNSRMTEADRLEVIKKIREDLRRMNKKVRVMNRLIYSTTLMDSWYELTGRSPHTRSMKEIATECHKGWINRVKKVKN